MRKILQMREEKCCFVCANYSFKRGFILLTRLIFILLSITLPNGLHVATIMFMCELSYSHQPGRFFCSPHKYLKNGNFPVNRWSDGRWAQEKFDNVAVGRWMRWLNIDLRAINHPNNRRKIGHTKTRGAEDSCIHSWIINHDSINCGTRNFG